jgi:glycosyltransferase involved in cell wall biosynthesis
MRVGINATFLGTRAAGVETYVRNLIRSLAATDPETEYILYTQSSLPDSLIPGTERMRRVVVPCRRDGSRVPFAFSRVLAHARLDVVHEQTMAPFLFGAPFVVTVHDLYHEHYPQYYPARALARTRLYARITLHRAAAIIADSEFSKQDIVRFHGIAPHKVTVAHLAADPLFRPIHDDGPLAAVRARYGTGERFVLFVGALKSTKNLSTVIEAYVRLRRADATRHRLVLVGGTTAWLKEDIFAAARASGYSDEIVFTGYVPDDDLVALYNAADIFVSPSLFEGFGLPPLEAMACGTPVVTSNTTSLPEVVGDAALMVDPLDAEALAGAMSAVLADDALRAQLSRQGLERAATFSWEATARTVLGVYRDVVGAARH